ncbi:MAG: P27 family phage terminase small subunit [Paludibacteraceae bacterium]|nr:P27 family phage terminase small subunit [Paludibacteraceae bacterium]
MDLIRAALEAADLYKPEKEPAIYMLATLLELYQKTRAAIEKDGLTVENSTKTTFKTVANPAVAMNLSYAKAIQNYLQQLGLSAAMAKAGDAGSSGGSDMADSPLTELRNAIEGNRTPVILKLKTNV